MELNTMNENKYIYELSNYYDKEQIRTSHIGYFSSPEKAFNKLLNILEYWKDEIVYNEIDLLKIHSFVVIVCKERKYCIQKVQIDLEVEK